MIDVWDRRPITLVNIGDVLEGKHELVSTAVVTWLSTTE